MARARHRPLPDAEHAGRAYGVVSGWVAGRAPPHLNRCPGEKRDPFFSVRQAGRWVPASAWKPYFDNLRDNIAAVLSTRRPMGSAGCYNARIGTGGLAQN